MSLTAFSGSSAFFTDELKEMVQPLIVIGVAVP
jgi:hypothetical protein